jgi:hypothetical protein
MTEKTLSAAEVDAQMEDQMNAQQEVAQASPELKEFHEQLDEKLEGALSEPPAEIDPEEEIVYDGTTGGKRNHQETWTTELMQVGMTESELAALAVEMNKISVDLNKKMLEFAQIKKSLKKEIDTLEAEMQSMLLQVEEGYEKEIKCIKKVCFDTNKVVFHDGKGTIYSTRVMQEDDKQLKLTVEVPASAMASTGDAIDAGLNITPPEETLKEMKENEPEEMEQITETMLTENKPSGF